MESLTEIIDQIYMDMILIETGENKNHCIIHKSNV